MLNLLFLIQPKTVPFCIINLKSQIEKTALMTQITLRIFNKKAYLHNLNFECDIFCWVFALQCTALFIILF